MIQLNAELVKKNEKLMLNSEEYRSLYLNTNTLATLKAFIYYINFSIVTQNINFKRIQQSFNPKNALVDICDKMHWSMKEHENSVQIQFGTELMDIFIISDPHGYWSMFYNLMHIFTEKVIFIKIIKKINNK